MFRFPASVFVAVAVAADPVAAGLACFPECSPGYLCHEAICIEACNPACGPGARCREDRTCEPIEQVPNVVPDATPAEVGSLCVFRAANVMGSLVPWQIDLDGNRLGSVQNARYACFDVPSGAHQLRVTHPAMTGAGTGYMVVVAPAPTCMIAVSVPVSRTLNISGRFGSGSILLAPVSEAAGLAMKAESKESKP